jgi:anti-sigma factor RsiW
MRPIAEISCVEAWREISEMVDGTLDPEMSQRMELHLRNCAHCKAVYDGTHNTVQLIADDRVFEMPAGFLNRLFQHLSSEFCDAS